MKYIKQLSIVLISSALMACGGGGGSPGSVTGSAPGTVGQSVTGSTQTTTTGSMELSVLNGVGVSTQNISAVEISKVQVLLKDTSGVAVSGAVVTFSEKDGSLLSFSPAAKSALTDSSGVASVEIRAASTVSIGATTVVATATLSGVSIEATRAIAISSAPAGVVADPQALANAVNFLDANPADKSIVLQGSGGNGRSESATLRFRVVDKNNTPVKGAVATFAVVPSSDVTLNISSATSDADGVVVTTVSSKNVATAVVIKATVTRTDTTTVTSQSDTLLVTTGVATLAGFDLSASKFNLNSGISGDKSTITVRIGDANGNLVADGVPVVFTASHGAVGSSSRGGCVLAGGECTVDYIVQNPRPADGVAAVVTASTQIGSATPISGTISFLFAEPALLSLYSAPSGGVKDLTFAFGTSCGKRTFTRYVGTPAGSPSPAGTTVGVTSSNTDVKASVKTGLTVPDQATARTKVDIEIDLTSVNCTGGGTPNSVDVAVTFTAGTISKTETITVTYGSP